MVQDILNSIDPARDCCQHLQIYAPQMKYHQPADLRMGNFNGRRLEFTLILPSQPFHAVSYTRFFLNADLAR